jgi:acyl-CoA synthetase (AMP-forming)/AMP-acid ligase II
MRDDDVWHSPYPPIDRSPGLLHEEVIGRARGWPGRTALTDAATGSALTYDQLADSADRLARGLTDRGAQPGDVLMLVAANCAEFPWVLHGALAAGLTVTPANPLLTARELANQLARTGARFVVASPAALWAVTQAAAAAATTPTVLALGASDLGGGDGVMPLAELKAGDRDQARPGDPASGLTPAVAGEAVAPASLALLVSSSGTSGLPKSVALTHDAVVASLRQLAATPHLALGPADAVGMVVPYAHGFGCLILNHALRSGARVVSLPRFDFDQFLGMLQQHRVTVTPVVPPVALALARAPQVDRYDLSSLRLVLVAAAPCSAEVERACADRLGCVVGQALGMTEAAPLAVPAETVVPGSVGCLAASTEAVVVDPVTGCRLGPGETGELWVRGPQLMRGYLGDDAATAATIDPDGWLHSGDLVSFDHHGNLFVVDRLKEMIKYCGYQVAPAELEAELMAHPAVGDAAVVPRPDPRAGQVPVAYVVLRQPADPAAISQWLAGRVAAYKRVWDVVVTDQIPRSPTGKLLRRRLAERERQQAPAARP